MRELGLPRDALLSVIVRGEEALLPRGSTRIEADDRLHVIVREEVAGDMADLLERWRLGPVGVPSTRQTPLRAGQAVFTTPHVDRGGRRRGLSEGGQRRPRGRAGPDAPRPRGALVLLEDGRFAVTGPLLAVGGPLQLQRYARRRLTSRGGRRGARVVAGGHRRAGPLSAMRHLLPSESWLMVAQSSRTRVDLGGETPMADDARARDEERLAELGYKQELERAWSSFSNFAISFTIISVLAGCFTTYGQAWNNGGPIAISWGWPIICALILAVAFSMSELASAYPTAGGPYWWATKLGGPAWSWFTGWFNVIGLIAVVASVDYACATFLANLLNLWSFDFIVDFTGAVELDEVFLLFAVIMVLHALINIYSSHLVALFNNVSVVVHVVGVAVIIGILIFVPDTSPERGLRLHGHDQQLRLLRRIDLELLLLALRTAASASC